MTQSVITALWWEKLWKNSNCNARAANFQLLFVWRLFTFWVSHGETYLNSTFNQEVSWRNKKCPCYCHPLLFAKPHVMSWGPTENSLLSCILASSPPNPPPPPHPTSGLHFPFPPRQQDVCVLAHLRESRPCGCWWLILGFTPVTALHNGLFPQQQLCCSEWSSVHQTLMSSTSSRAWKLLVTLLWLHAQQQHFET